MKLTYVAIIGRLHGDYETACFSSQEPCTREEAIEAFKVDIRSFGGEDTPDKDIYIVNVLFSDTLIRLTP